MPILSPTIRPPCGGLQTLNKVWLAGCAGQNINKNNEGIKILSNITMVRDPSGVGYTLPYTVAEQRLAPDCSPYNEGGCPDNPCYQCGDFGLTNQNTPCWDTWSAANMQPCLTSSGYSTVTLPAYFDAFTDYTVGPFFNCFQQTNATKSINACSLPFGRKNVYASKAWPGNVGRNDPSQLRISYMDCCTNCIYTPPYPNPGQVKYLGVTANSSLTKINIPSINVATPAGDLCCPNAGCIFPCFSPDDGATCCCPSFCYTYTPDPQPTITANASCNRSIDKFGNQFNNGASSGSSNDPDGFFAEQAFNDLGNIMFTQQQLKGQYRSFYELGGFEVSNGAWVLSECSSADGVVSSAWTATYVDTDYCGNVTFQGSYTALKLVLNLNDNSLDIYQWGTNRIPPGCDSEGTSFAVIQTMHEHWKANDTSFEWSIDATGEGSLSFFQSQHEDANGSYYSPYTAQNVKDDLKTLLSFYPLDDDVLLPWQLTYVGGPYLHYDEGTGQTVPSFPDSSPTQILYNPNTVIGKPAPKGTSNIWAPQHSNWCVCDSLTNPGNLIFYVRDHGAYSTNIDINAPCATNWLDVAQQSQMPQGGFMKMNMDFSIPASFGGDPVQSFDDVLWASKYAQTLIPNKQSFDFSRPNQSDRFWPTSSGYAMTGFDTGSGVITVDSAITSPPITDIHANDYIWLCGISGSIDGCYKVASSTDTTITIAHQVATASVLPYKVIENCGSGIVVKLRWQPPLKPAITGRVGVSFATSTTPVTCSLADQTWLVTGDEVTIVSAVGSNVNGDWTITVIDNHTIILNGSDAHGFPAYTGGGQIFSKGCASSWSYADITTKNNFVKYDFGNDFRGVQDWQRLADQYQAVIDNMEVTCDGVTPCFNPAPPPQPRPSQASCGVDQSIISQSCRTNCIPETHCGNAVMFISPNNETFGGAGKNMGWFDGVVLDSEYGTLSQSLFRQLMPDLYFMAPPCPPEFDLNTTAFDCYNFIWDEEPNGECLNDFIDDFGFQHRLYAARATFEPVCELPFNSSSHGFPAPILVGDGDGYLGCLSIAQLNSPTSCSIGGNICTPPVFSAPAVLNQGETCPAVNSTDLYFVWENDVITYLNKFFCVCNGGRQDVIDKYIENGFVCSGSSISPP